MKKQGFTLIELMVVIVIMGILAAVAVPKLFGMIAKSKASEVPTAAGTWINLQDAYVTESNALGDWNQVGYTGPGKRNSTSSYSSANFDYYGESGTWHAKNTVKLNECNKDAGIWTLTATLVNASSNDQGQSGMTLKASNTDAQCMGLTPSFEALENNYKAASGS